MVLKYWKMWSRSRVQPYMQCCGAATFLGGSGSGSPRSWSRLRLRPNWVGYGSCSRQKKAAPGGSGSIHKHFSFWALKKWIINASFFGSHLLGLTVSYFAKYETVWNRSLFRRSLSLVTVSVTVLPRALSQVTVSPKYDRFSNLNETFRMAILHIFRWSFVPFLWIVYFSLEFCTLIFDFRAFSSSGVLFSECQTILTGLDCKIRNSFRMTFSRIRHTKYETVNPSWEEPSLGPFLIGVGAELLVQIGSF